MLFLKILEAAMQQYTFESVINIYVIVKMRAVSS